MRSESARSGDLRCHPVFVVAVVTAAQMATAMTNAVLPTMAPKVAESLGIEPAWVGYQVSTFFAAAMVGMLYLVTDTPRTPGSRVRNAPGPSRAARASSSMPACWPARRCSQPPTASSAASRRRCTRWLRSASSRWQRWRSHFVALAAEAQCMLSESPPNGRRLAPSPPTPLPTGEGSVVRQRLVSHCRNVRSAELHLHTHRNGPSDS
jgi:hypothetical protein